MQTVFTNTNEPGYLVGSYTFTDTPKQYGYFNGVNVILSGSSVFWV